MEIVNQLVFEYILLDYLDDFGFIFEISIVLCCKYCVIYLIR